jgi:hypothetical protein
MTNGNGALTRDVPWTGTGGPSDINSYSWLFLNAVYNRLSTSTLFKDFVVKRITDALPINAAYQIPYIGIYLGSETAVPDGEFNATNIRFMHSVPIGIQIVVKNNDPVVMQQTLDQAKWFVLNQLFRDNTLTNFYTANMSGDPNDPMHVEGFPRLRIPKPDWARDSKSETPIGMQLIELTVTWGTHFEPTNFDDLKEIAVTAYPELAPTDPAELLSVTVVHRFDPDYVEPPLTGPGP